MNTDNLLGRVVYSKAGRDKKRPFIILNIINNDYVSIVDGKLRTIEKPKKKKIKHLNITDCVIDDIKQLIVSKDNLSNLKVKRYLENRDTIKEG